MKRESTDWKKMFVKCVSDKGDIYILHEEILQINNKLTIQLKMDKNLGRYPS